MGCCHGREETTKTALMAPRDRDDDPQPNDTVGGIEFPVNTSGILEEEEDYGDFGGSREGPTAVKERDVKQTEIHSVIGPDPRSGG